jgi:hypothetical protein
MLHLRIQNTVIRPVIVLYEAKDYLGGRRPFLIIHFQSELHAVSM